MRIAAQVFFDFVEQVFNLCDLWSLSLRQFLRDIGQSQVDSDQQLSCFVVDGISDRSEEHTSELQSLAYLVCRLLLEKKKIHLISDRSAATDDEGLVLDVELLPALEVHDYAQATYTVVHCHVIDKLAAHNCISLDDVR